MNAQPPQSRTRPGGTANLKAQADVKHDTGRIGHLYAIEFSSGTLKVGQSRSIARRIAAHVAAAAAHGVTADCIWISEPVDHLDARERDLLAFCAARWRLASGGEHFRRADIAKVVEQANRAGAATREVQGRPLPAPDAGPSWTLAFKGHPAGAAEVRAWTRRRVHHPDAPTVANELFVAILGAGADVVEMQLSTAGDRLKVTATGPQLLPLRHSHGPGWRIINGLSRTNGVTTDERGLWAQLAAED